MGAAGQVNVFIPTEELSAFVFKRKSWKSRTQNDGCNRPQDRSAPSLQDKIILVEYQSCVCGKKFHNSQLHSKGSE